MIRLEAYMHKARERSQRIPHSDEGARSSRLGQRPGLNTKRDPKILSGAEGCEGHAHSSAPLGGTCPVLLHRVVHCHYFGSDSNAEFREDHLLDIVHDHFAMGNDH